MQKRRRVVCVRCPSHPTNGACCEDPWSVCPHTAGTSGEGRGEGRGEEGRGEGGVIALGRASQEEQNGPNFSFIAPSSEEL